MGSGTGRMHTLVYRAQRDSLRRNARFSKVDTHSYANPAYLANRLNI
jgi:hypothetical protein